MFGGSVQGMRLSLNNNKKLLRSKRFFTKEKTFLSIKTDYLKIASKGHLDLKKASKEDILRVRNKVLKERKKANYILIAIFSIILTVSSVLVFNFIQHENEIEITQKKAIFKTKQKQFLNFLKMGDDWFIQAKWYNSIHYYTKAKALFPKNFEVNYRILNALSLECQYDFNNCEKAQDLLQELKVNFPEKRNEFEVIEIRLGITF